MSVFSFRFVWCACISAYTFSVYCFDSHGNLNTLNVNVSKTYENALYAIRNTERKSPIIIHSARNLGRFVSVVVVGDDGGSGGVYKL